MLKIDLHIHTIHSGHAYGTFYDVIKEAARKKMKMIAVTDHGPSILGSASMLHFGMGIRAPKKYKGVKVLWGCEDDPDKNGNLSLKGKWAKHLDILIVAVHDMSHFKNWGKKKNTEVLIKCFKKYKPHIFAHPERMQYDYDLEKVCQAACDLDILLEVNIAGLANALARKKHKRIENLKKMIRVANKNKKKIIVNSDAHFLHEIGDDSLLKKNMKMLGLTKTMIINNYPKELDKILKRKIVCG